MTTKQKPQRKAPIKNLPILDWNPKHYMSIEEFADKHSVVPRTVYAWRAKHPDELAFYQIRTEDGGWGEKVYVRRNQVVTDDMRKVGRPKKK